MQKLSRLQRLGLAFLVLSCACFVIVLANSDFSWRVAVVGLPLAIATVIFVLVVRRR